MSNFTAHHLKQLITKQDIKIRPSLNQVQIQHISRVIMYSTSYFAKVELNPYQTDPEINNFCKKEGILVQVSSCDQLYNTYNLMP